MGLEIEYFEGGVRRTWRPFPRQEKFISLPDEVFEAFYGGALGGGKSELLVLLPVLRGWHKKRSFRGIIFRRTIPELRESLIPRSEEIYKALGADYNSQYHTWTFPSGATVKFSHLESMADARSHDTAEFHYAAFDELTHFEENEYTYIAGSRVRSTDPDIPALVRSASNPGNIGHAWVRALFVEPDPEGLGDTIIYDGTTNTYRCFVRARLEDNFYWAKYDPNYVNRIRRLKIINPAEYKAKAEGDWWVFAGQVFTEFRVNRISGEPESALHVIEPFRIPDWWTRILSVDWGGSNPDTKARTWAGWFAIAPKNRVYLYREYTAKEKIQVWASDVARLSTGEDLRRVVLDPSAWAQRGDAHTLHQQFVEATGFHHTYKADNDRLGGLSLLHEYFRWKPLPPRYVPPGGYDPELAARIFRVHGSKAVKEYQEMFLPQRPEGPLPKLLVFEHCTAFIDVIPKCVYNEPGKAGKNVEDVKEFDGDDPYDGGRYGVKAVDDYLNSPDLEEEHKRREDVGSIVGRLEQTGDQTAFYRAMEAHERKYKEDDSPVALYHAPRVNRRKNRR